MAQTTTAPAPDAAFVATLRANIQGIYFSTAAGYSPAKIEEEFRKAVQSRELRNDETFMTNLMFLVRKREVSALRDDVRRVVEETRLPPAADISTLKTLYALGDGADRATVDKRVSIDLKRQMVATDALEMSEIVRWGGRIGGEQTLAALRDYQAEATRRQQDAEKTSTNDFERIVKIDQLRNRLTNEVSELGRKLDLEKLPEPVRAASMTEHFLRRSGHLGYWSYKYLVDHPTDLSIAAVREYLDRKIGGLLPLGGISADEGAELTRDYRLRGVCLLQKMKAKMTPQESKMLLDNSAMLKEREEFFWPNHDWEDALDVE